MEIPEWKFNANIARNTTFEGNQDQSFNHVGSKMTKSDYFRGFYFS